MAQGVGFEPTRSLRITGFQESSPGLRYLPL